MAHQDEHISIENDGIQLTWRGKARSRCFNPGDSKSPTLARSIDPRRPRFLRQVATVVALLSTTTGFGQDLSTTPPSQQQQVPPNVVLIMADDLFIDIACYGNEQIHTPNLNRLAQRGATFDQAYANYPLCGPSRNSMMSGRYAENTGLTGLRDKLRDRHPDMVTLAQHFRDHGYRVARVGKIFHADNPSGIGKAEHDDPESWDIALNPSGRDREIEDDIIRISHLREDVPDGPWLGAQLSWYADPEGDDLEHTDGMIATEAVRLMERFTAEDRPFFIGIGFYKPHTPFVAPEKYFQRYDVEAMPVPAVPEGYLDTLPGAAVPTIRSKAEWMPGQIDIPRPLAQQVVRAYYATVTYLDSNVGRVLDAIERLDIGGETIILFLSDHGYHLGEHGHWQKRTLFNQANQIPLIVSAPGMKGIGERADGIVELVDMYRTLSELAGLREPTWTDGRSFAKALQHPDTPLRESAVSAISTNGRSYSLRTPNWRLNRWGEENLDALELYDTRTDPQELINLAQRVEYAEILGDLQIRLGQRQAAMKTPPH